ncbi:MAG: PqqD family protein [Acidobacteriota bacterium]
MPDRFRRRRDVRFRIIDSEAVVLRQQAGETLVLNEVGSRILQLCDEGESFDGVVRSISQEFDVEPPQAEADARQFISQLVDAGILEAEAVSP